MLVDAGACINVRNTYTERVPLHEAAINDNFEAVKLLLELGGPYMPRCVRDITPAQFARYFDHTTVAEYLGNTFSFTLRNDSCNRICVH